MTVNGIAVLLACTAASGACAQGLQVHFGARGVEQLSYKGELLEDLKKWPDDTLHIGHMLCLDAHGKPLSEGGYGWGETNRGRAWDAATKTWTYSMEWGTIRVAYEQHGDALDIHVTEMNRRDSGITVDGASIFPMTLHLPVETKISTQIADDVEAPGVTTATWGEERLAIVVPDESKLLYSGFQAPGDGVLQLIVSSTRPDALPHMIGEMGRRMKAGETDTFVVSVRFGAASEPVASVAGDALKSFARRWPELLKWEDRRAIGTVFLASSPQGEKRHGGGFPSNPRRYFNDAALSVRTSLPAFQARVLQQAETVVENLKRMDAQGAITWDIEGEEFPQDTSYLCSPDKIADAAPEMESLLASGQKYAGMKLDDAYFKLIRDAGFRVGVCVRPQKLVMGPDGTAEQQNLPEDKVASELIRKMRFAHDHWGATIFYLDSTVRADGTTLPASVIEEAAAAMPDSLLIPEESTLRMYRATAPFETFLFHGDRGTADEVRAMYPRGFSANMINDVDAHKLEADRAVVTESVREGDVLMGLAGFWHPNDAAIALIYRDARKR